MPTDRPRHVITETEQVARALDDAARLWPEDRHRRSRLLLHLIEEGHKAVESLEQRDSEARRAAVKRTAGALTGVFGDRYLTRLRRDWPS